MSSASRRPILLAEDDEEDRFLIARALTRVNNQHPLHTVEDGVELLDYLRGKGEYGDRETHPMPSLILLDLNMPRMDGRAALTQLRADPALRALPVVVLTTSESEEDIVGCYREGANAYICKPTSFDDLVESLRALCEYWFEIVELPEIPEI